MSRMCCRCSLGLWMQQGEPALLKCALGSPISPPTSQVFWLWGVMEVHEPVGAVCFLCQLNILVWGKRDLESNIAILPLTILWLEVSYVLFLSLSFFIFIMGMILVPISLLGFCVDKWDSAPKLLTLSLLLHGRYWNATDLWLLLGPELDRLKDLGNHIYPLLIGHTHPCCIGPGSSSLYRLMRTDF